MSLQQTKRETIATRQEKRLAKLRQRHTDQFNAGKFVEMQSTRDKIIDCLNVITEQNQDWREQC